MLHVKKFTFNPFAENTYLLWGNSQECLIIDPGCSTPAERKELDDFIDYRGLLPINLINTHCHIDHVLGNAHVFQRYGLTPLYHEAEQAVLDSCPVVADMYGMPYEAGPYAERFLEEGEKIQIDDHVFTLLWCPGHSPGSLVLYDGSQIAIAGDVLFYESIGRTDLPGGDHETLLQSIKAKLWSLSDEVKVCPGHGPETTIGHERRHNPFLRS